MVSHSELIDALQLMDAEQLLEIIAEARAGKSVDINNMEEGITEKAKDALQSFIGAAQMKAAPEE